MPLISTVPTPRFSRRRAGGWLVVGAALAALAAPAAATASPADPVDSGPVEAMIIGGTPATIEVSPWQVRLLIGFGGSNRFLCGGSLLSEEWVLTAAHCVQANGVPASSISVAAGTTFANVPAQSVAGARVVVHPGYSEPSFLNDIALVRLASPVVLDGVTTATIALPAGLPPEWPAVDTPSLITGWGEVSNSDSVPLPNQLQQATISILAAPGGPCVVQASPGYAPNQMMCAGTRTGEPGACRGDSGGAAAVQTNGVWYVAGITSHGAVPCAQPNNAGVYTRVTAYLDWIASALVAGQVDTVTVVGGQAAVAAPVEAEAGAAVGVVPGRIAGANRYATSVAVAQAMFPAGVDAVYLATGTGFADALSASNGLATNNAALLLTDAGNLPAEVAAELQRLAPSQVLLIGGAGAISDQVAQQVAATVGFAPARLAGPNRYETAVAVAQQAFPGGASMVYLATGTGFADALAASAAMTGGQSALLLTEPGQLPAAVAAELQRLNPAGVIVIGGTTAVNDAVVQQVQGVLGVSPQRLGGSNRYATAALVNGHAFPAGNTQVFLATGQQFPDALSAAQAVISRRAALLLTERDVLPAATLAELQRLNR